MRKREYTKFEQKTIDKYEDFVLNELNKIDPIGVLPAASDDHYAIDARCIALRIPGCKTAQHIAESIYVVIAFLYDIFEAGDVSKYLPMAEQIMLFQASFTSSGNFKKDKPCDIKSDSLDD